MRLYKKYALFFSNKKVKAFVYQWYWKLGFEVSKDRPNGSLIRVVGCIKKRKRKKQEKCQPNE
jgi:hypothetical protein